MTRLSKKSSSCSSGFLLSTAVPVTPKSGIPYSSPCFFSSEGSDFGFRFEAPPFGIGPLLRFPCFPLSFGSLFPPTFRLLCRPLAPPKNINNMEYLECGTLRNFLDFFDHLWRLAVLNIEVLLKLSEYVVQVHVVGDLPVDNEKSGVKEGVCHLSSPILDSSSSYCVDSMYPKSSRYF